LRKKSDIEETRLENDSPEGGDRRKKIKPEAGLF